VTARSWTSGSRIGVNRRKPLLSGEGTSVVERIVLVGMMGAGKSTVGRALADRLNWSYLDNDEVVAKLTGLPTRELLAQRGVAGLRAAESRAVDEVLAAPPPLVAGAAAGIVEDEAACARLRAGAYVVYLRARLETLVERVTGTDRPWLGDDPAGALRRLYAGREPRYQQLAHLVVDVDDRSADDVATAIINAAGIGVGR
jgi:shikimate kinase